MRRAMANRSRHAIADQDGSPHLRTAGSRTGVQAPIEPSPDQELGRAFAIIAVAFALVLFAAPKIRNEIDALAGAISHLHVYPYAWLAERMPAMREIPFLGPACSRGRASPCSSWSRGTI